MGGHLITHVAAGKGLDITAAWRRVNLDPFGQCQCPSPGTAANDRGENIFMALLLMKVRIE